MIPINRFESAIQAVEECAFLPRQEFLSEKHWPNYVVARRVLCWVLIRCLGYGSSFVANKLGLSLSSARQGAAIVDLCYLDLTPPKGTYGEPIVWLASAVMDLLVQRNIIQSARADLNKSNCNQNNRAKHGTTISKTR